MIETINKQKVKEIGKNLYQDSRGKIYILNYRKDAWVVLDSNDQKLFQIYRSRMVIAILAGFLCFYYSNNVVLSAALGVLLFMFSEISYRKLFIDKLLEVETIKSKDNGSYSYKRAMLNNDYPSLYKKLLLSILICGLFAYNFVDMKLNINSLFNFVYFNNCVTTWLYLLMIIGSFVMSVATIVIIILKKRGNIK